MIPDWLTPAELAAIADRHDDIEQDELEVDGDESHDSR